MNLLTLSLAGLRGGRLTQLLNILILALGLGTVTLLLLFSQSLNNRLTQDARHIDMVVGAKGSPLQLVLSSVFQADIPNGNIPLAEAQALLQNPMIAQGVPIALGDAVGSFRIVGTDPDYLGLYDAHLAQGAMFRKPLDAVLGSQTAESLGLHLGDHFIGAHGVGGDGDLHRGFPYTVTGILAPTGTIIDRVALTPVESVWEIHKDELRPGAPPEITALLIRMRTPLAVVVLPHLINARTTMMAAVPSLEAARLLSLVGIGIEAFHALAWVLVASSGLGMLIALIARLRARRRELAVLRLLGASRLQLLATVLIEALALAAAGAAAGLLLGHLGAWGLAHWLPPGDAMAQIGFGLQPAEWRIPAAAFGAALLAAAFPAIAAYRSDVAAALSDFEE